MIRFHTTFVFSLAGLLGFLACHAEPIGSGGLTGATADGATIGAGDVGHVADGTVLNGAALDSSVVSPPWDGGDAALSLDASPEDSSVEAGAATDSGAAADSAASCAADQVRVSTGACARWSAVPSGTFEVLHDVWAGTSSEAWVVGESGTILRWYRGRWDVVDTGYGFPGLDLLSVHGKTTPSAAGDIQCLKVGGNYGVILTKRSGSDIWDQALLGAGVERGEKIYDIVCENEAVSGGGSRAFVNYKASGSASAESWLLGYDAGGWHPLSSFGILGVGSIAQASPGVTWLATYDHVRRCGAGGCSLAGPAFNVGIFAAAADDVWAVGTGATHYDGATWLSASLPTGTAGYTFRSVWAGNRNDAWAVGDAGRIMHWDGRMWDRAVSPTSLNLRAVYGSGPDDVWAVGDHGTLLHLGP